MKKKKSDTSKNISSCRGSQTLASIIDIFLWCRPLYYTPTHRRLVEAGAKGHTHNLAASISDTLLRLVHSISRQRIAAYFYFFIFKILRINIVYTREVSGYFN